MTKRLFTIKDKSREAKKSCWQIHDAEDRMVCWCESMSDAIEYVAGTLNGEVKGIEHAVKK